jgi:HD superfamily phosphodiesterase
LELLYAGAMFHDIGLTKPYRSSMLRFEVNGANAARDLPTQHGTFCADAACEIILENSWPE